MTKRTKSKRFRIAVLISPDMGVRRESLRGVYHYASGKTDWDLSLMWPLEESMWKSLVRQPMEGALVWPKFEAEVEHLGPLKVPIVTIGSLAHAGHSSVFFDNRAAARIGVEELATKGLKSVAFYGSRSNFRYGVERRLGYLKTVKTLGLSENVLAEEVSEPKWARLERWLRALPKPSGVLADTDVGGLTHQYRWRRSDLPLGVAIAFKCCVARF
jgi:DNA-binding LacI/PurR family transcriptional regulator